MVDDDAQLRRALTTDLQNFYEGTGIFVEQAENVKDALAALDELDLSTTDVPLIIADFAMPGPSGVELFRTWRRERGHKDTRLLLLSGQVGLEQISTALSEELLDAYLPKPYQLDRLEQEVKKAVSKYYLDFHPQRLSHQPKLVSHLALQQALEKAIEDRNTLTRQMNQLKQGAFAGRMDQNVVSEKLTEELVRWLNSNHRTAQVFSYSANDIVLDEGQKNECLWFVLAGTVVQEKKGRYEKVELMEQGVGELVGLLSLLSQRSAFSTIRAKTACRLARLSREDLDDFLANQDTDVSLFFRSLLVTLHHRVTTVSETKVLLQDAHLELKNAQIKLVESAKMATLGMLTAGVAHELNNPAAAIIRACDHIRSGLLALLCDEHLLSMQKDTALMEGEKILRATFEAVPVSTAALRASTKHLSETYDTFYARMLAELQLTLPSVWPPQAFVQAKTLAEKQGWIEFFHRFFQLGLFLGNINSCSERVSSLVRGMKNYARAENADYAFIDVCEGLEDTFLVLGNRLKRFDFEKSYAAQLPKVKAVASQLNQVWTNLLSNACDATPPGGKISVTVTSKDSFVYIAVRDFGEGIPDAIRSRIFEPRFTTKKGDTEHFGLGLGLAIVKKIVLENSGEIAFLSNEPGCSDGTEFIVKLPVAMSAEESGIKNEERATKN